MQENKAVLLAAVAAVLLVASTTVDDAYFISSDSWERTRAADELLESGRVPERLAIYEPAPTNTYPPLFDLSLAQLKAFSGLDFVALLRLLSLAQVFAFTVLSFYFFRGFVEPRAALFASLALFALPRFFRLAMEPIPELTGLLLLVAALRLAHTGRHGLAAALVAALSLMHARTFIYFFPLLLVFAWAGKWKAKNVAKYLAAPILLLPLFWLPRLDALPQTAQPFNPFIHEWGFLELFGLSLFPLAYLLHGIFLGKERTQAKPFLAWMAVFGALSLYGAFAGQNVLYFRSLMYLALPVALFSGMALDKIVERRQASATSLLVLLLLFSLQLNYFFVPGNTGQGVAAMQFLRGTDTETVATDFVSAYAVPAVTGKKVILGAFSEAMPDAETRIWTLTKLFMGPMDSLSMALLNKYGAKAVLYKAEYPEQFQAFAFPSFDKAYDSGHVAVFLLRDEDG